VPPDQEPASRPAAVVFAVLPPGRASEREGEDRLAEIKELLASADIDCVGEVVQHRARPDGHAYLGPGKLLELGETVDATAATCAVCEDDLAPAQVAAVLDALDVDVLDRTELILSVFARHAHSLEGKLQVDLAQLQYELTRMRGKGHVMSRLGAGTDMRGPGEQKLEVDRRVVRQRIQTLRRRIDHMARTRGTQRARRLTGQVPLIALAGYTNAGKSTLLNRLTDAGVSVRDRLFETLDPTTRSYRYRDRDYVMTDTVGFIRKLPHMLVDAFASTLEETRVADLLLIVADGSQPLEEIHDHLETVGEVLEEIGATAVPRLLALNKIDRLDAAGRSRLAAAYPEAVLLSALDGEGVDALEERVAAFFERHLVRVRLLIPYERGGEVSRLHGIAADIRVENTGEGVVVEALLPDAETARYATYRIDRRSARPAEDADATTGVGETADRLDDGDGA
jgi:GTP-binding protein HflX